VTRLSGPGISDGEAAGGEGEGRSPTWNQGWIGGKRSCSSSRLAGDGDLHLCHGRKGEKRECPGATLNINEKNGPRGIVLWLGGKASSCRCLCSKYERDSSFECHWIDERQ
jgi:hypothetical protein